MAEFPSIFGTPAQFPKNTLPTIQDVFRAYYYYKINFQKYDKKDRFELLASLINQKYEKCQIECISIKSIQEKIQRFYEEYKKNSKSEKKYGKSGSVKNFQTKSKLLFEVAKCKKNLQNCLCNYCKDLPEEIKSFLFDQRNQRLKRFPLTSLSNLTDYGPSTSQTTPSKSKRSISSAKITPSSNIPKTGRFNYLNTPQSSSTTTNSTKKDLKSYKNTKDISNISKAAIRFGLSNAAASSIANATLIDFGIITNEEEKKCFKILFPNIKFNMEKKKFAKWHLKNMLLTLNLDVLVLMVRSTQREL